MNKIIKGIRVGIALIFILSICAVFIDMWELIPVGWTNRILFLQFVPSILKFANILGWAGIGFITILILTLMVGRVYCSFICPLGILQDVFIFLKKKIIKKVRFAYKRPKNVLRYTFFAATIITFFSGSMLLLYLLDPYSAFGRISSSLAKPVIIGLNNVVSSVFQSMDIFTVYPVNFTYTNLGTIAIPAAFFILIAWMSLSQARLYCNMICPVGTLLGLVSRISIFKIKINNKCTKCGRCAMACKANCIDFKKGKVDFDRCVGCYNCIASCPDDAIAYKLSHANKKTQANTKSKMVDNTMTNDSTRRSFFKSIFASVLGYAAIETVSQAQGNKNELKVQSVNKKNAVSPPGSLSHKHFHSNCTACHLCITACPTKVLQPSFLEYGLKGMLQPHLDYKTSFCNYDCTICSEVCPTGAILEITENKKKQTQLGIARFIKGNCIVYKAKTSCGACAEHCPTKAVHMVAYEQGLTIPEVRPEICVGCGACEFACPESPKAIYIEGHTTHLKAEEPKTEKLQSPDPEEDFPF